MQLPSILANRRRVMGQGRVTKGPDARCAWTFSLLGSSLLQADCEGVRAWEAATPQQEKAFCKACGSRAGDPHVARCK